MLFTQERRPYYCQIYPDKSITEIAKEIGNEWKRLDIATKGIWTEKHLNLKRLAEIEKEN